MVLNLVLPYGAPASWEDRLLHLYLFGKLGRQNKINEIQEQKLYFLTQYNACQDGGILSYVGFIRGKFGPVAPHIYDMERFAIKNSWISAESSIYYDMPQQLMSITEKGMKIFDELEELFEDQAKFFQFVDMTLLENLDPQEGTMKKGWDLRQEVYEIKIDGVKIRDVPLRQEIRTIPLKVKWAWEIPKDWEFTVKFLLSPGNLESLEMMSVENKSEAFTPYKWG